MKTIDPEQLTIELTRISIAKFGYSVFKHCRKREAYLKPRTACMYALKSHPDIHFSLSEVGRICANGKPFDHATVLFAARTIGSDLELYKKGYQMYKQSDDMVQFWANEIEQLIKPDPLYLLKKQIKDYVDACTDEVELNGIVNKMELHNDTTRNRKDKPFF